MLTTPKKTLLFICLLLASPILQAQLLDDALDTATSGGLINSNNSGLATSAIQSVLPADSAFVLNAYIEAPNTLVIHWEIEDGYYLYHKSLSFTETSGNSLADPIIPTGIHTEDEFFGEVEVFYQRLLVRMPFDPNQVGNNISVQLAYQGCAEGNYCYPMQFKEIDIEIL